ncbi:hypothetical protein AKJ09_10557 [Labilithrix luteola]|uniref:Uncharacterized protein n=1 Tax=Labilithrix luteola TaxID=1391654 RepID=A0A0K1QDQ6_9BACT|nr:hypothetical protein AKJ09_10557 [Labilithrix luteola]
MARAIARSTLPATLRATRHRAVDGSGRAVIRGLARACSPAAGVRARLGTAVPTRLRRAGNALTNLVEARAVIAPREGPVDVGLTNGLLLAAHSARARCHLIDGGARSTRVGCRSRVLSGVLPCGGVVPGVLSGVLSGVLPCGGVAIVARTGKPRRVVLLLLRRAAVHGQGLRRQIAATVRATSHRYERSKETRNSNADQTGPTEKHTVTAPLPFANAAEKIAYRKGIEPTKVTLARLTIGTPQSSMTLYKKR